MKAKQMLRNYSKIKMTHQFPPHNTCLFSSPSQPCFTPLLGSFVATVLVTTSVVTTTATAITIATKSTSRHPQQLLFPIQQGEGCYLPLIWHQLSSLLPLVVTNKCLPPRHHPPLHSQSHIPHPSTPLKAISLAHPFSKKIVTAQIQYLLTTSINFHLKMNIAF